MSPEARSPRPEDALTAAQRARFDTLRDGGPRRWRPTRLLLLNYWHYDEVELVFVQGRLVIRGANTTGKSTALAAAIPLALDAEKRSQRLDTFGEKGKTLAYYLVGDEKATPESEFYYDERTAYVAIEFEHRETDRYVTVGVGLHTKRGRADHKVDSWGFVIDDGRRVGIDLHLYQRHGGARIPLTMRQLRDVLGQDHVDDGCAAYQAMVNTALFGFDNVERYRELLGLLLELRSPKLNKDTKPSVVCELLAKSLVPLDDALLHRVAQVLDDIDDCLHRIEETRQQIAASKRLDELMASLANQLAQGAALDLRIRSRKLADTHGEHTRVVDELAAQRQKAHALGDRLREIAAREREIEARIGVLRKDEAFATEDELRRAEEGLKQALSSRARHGQAIVQAEEAVREHVAERDRIAAEFSRQRGRLQEFAAQAILDAGAAEWPLARDRCAAFAGALPGFELAGETDPGTALQFTFLDDQARRREGALRVAHTKRKAVEAAELQYAGAQASVETARRDRNDADERRRRALGDVARRIETAVAALGEWRAASTELRLSDEAFTDVRRRLAECTRSDHLGAVWAPIDEQVRRARRELERLTKERHGELAECKRRLAENESELATWRDKEEAEPPRRVGQAEARHLLATHMVPAVPLYAACDVRPDLSSEVAAALEGVLDEAGLLDALVVPERHADEVARLLGNAGLGDRWIRPVPRPADGGATLADWLVPVEGAVAADDVARALGSVAIGPGASGPAALGFARTWRQGLLEGSTQKREETESLYLGEANRRRERERQIARLELERAQHEADRARIEEDLGILDGRSERLSTEETLVRHLPALDALREGWSTLAAADSEVDRIGKRLEEAQAEATRKLGALHTAREQHAESVRDLPEARSRTAEGIHELLAAMMEALGSARSLADQTKALLQLRWNHRKATQLIAREEDRRDAAQAAWEEAEAPVQDWTAKRDALQERRAHLGRSVASLQDEIRELQTESRALRKEADAAREDRGNANGRLEKLEPQSEKLKRELDEAERDRAAALTALHTRLGAYPTLAQTLQRFLAGEHGADEAAEELLRLRRLAEEALADVLERDRKAAWSALSRALVDYRGRLDEYRPELGDEILQFREEGRRLLPFELLARLESIRAEQQRYFEEKESTLYERFVLHEIADEIRKRISSTETWVDRVNDLLKERRLSNGEILSLRWRPHTGEPDKKSGKRAKAEAGPDEKQPPPGKKRGPARLVELLRKDAELLLPEDAAEIKDYFRTRVKEVRERDRNNELPGRFQDALFEELDYRSWFGFTLHSKLPKHESVELTDSRYTTRSGAEKSLAVFIPLIAAASSRFDGSAPDAPRIIGLDEAFAGVDDGNTRDMFRFLSELEFSFIMTSEKLWGVADGLPGCATYEFLRSGSVFTAIFSFWDGTTVHSTLDAESDVDAPEQATGG